MAYFLIDRNIETTEVEAKMLNKLLKTIIFTTVLIFITLQNSFALTPNLTLNDILGPEKGFINPIGVATDGTNVYVADYGANKVFKIDASKNVTTFVNVNKPIAISYASNKIAVATESEGGKIYDATNGNLLASFGSGYTGSESFKNLVKPADLAIGTDGYIYATDMDDKYVKTYSLSTGSFISTVGNGAFPYYDPSLSFGNGQFYIPSGLTFDNTTNKLIIADFSNFSPYFQLTLKWNPFKKQYDKITSYSGRPKGKIQIFANPGTGYSCDPGTTGARQFVIHGTNPINGEVLTASSVYADNNFIYVLDSLGQKLFIFANVAIDSNLQSTSSGQYTYPVANPVNVDPLTTPPLYTIFYNAFDFSGINKISQLRDIIKVGSNTLVVTDTTGKVYYLTLTVI